MVGVVYVPESNLHLGGDIFLTVVFRVEGFNFLYVNACSHFKIIGFRQPQTVSDGRSRLTMSV